VNYKVTYGTTEIEFTLARRKRKTLAIHVYPDKHVEVVAPVDATIEKIYEKVKKRSHWICKKQREFLRIQPQQPKPEYISGETFRYLGKQYRLLVREGTPGVSLTNGKLMICAPSDYRSSRRKKLLWDWFRQKSRIIFSERFNECIKITTRIGINHIPEWHIKMMSKRWGSCTKQGKIYLNPELIAAPKPCIDYVIFHELCHTKEHNHGKNFINLLVKVYPDWKKWRDYLNENISLRVYAL
jgi:predicted metal-dependent hydrolase